MVNHTVMKLKLIVIICLAFSLTSCGIYSFSGADVGEAKTFQVNYINNNASIVEPGIERTFRLELQDLIQNQTNLGLSTEGADLIYEGEITEYYIAPITAVAENTAAQNRLTISVNIRFINTLEPENDLERRFSFYYDYPGGQQLIGSTLATALDEIYERLTQDIFNATLANW